MDDNLAIWFEKKAFKNANNNLGWSAFSSKRLFSMKRHSTQFGILEF
jgi:hypothetical protein